MTNPAPVNNTPVAASTTTMFTVPLAEEEAVAMAETVVKLRAEFHDIAVRQAQIRLQTKAIVAQLKRRALAKENQDTKGKPRPIEDRVAIASGRAIVQAKRRKKSADETLKLARKAAIKLGKRYGLGDSLSPEMEVKVADQVRVSFNL